LDAAAVDRPLDRTVWSTARTETLSDGVFAIVMTLLVLELKVPELPRDAPAADVWHGFKELGPIFFSYFTTFTLAGVFWFWHHRAFHELRHVEGPLFALNLVFLAFVSLLPFSTAMLGAFNLRQPVSLACYFGNLLGLALALMAFWLYARRSGALKPARDPAARRRFVLILVAHIMASGAALITIAIQPSLTMNIYVAVLMVGNVVTQRATRSMKARASAQ
jgi:TMEM175 potassium channel family protein